MRYKLCVLATAVLISSGAAASALVSAAGATRVMPGPMPPLAIGPHDPRLAPR
jgi:hypothetical protein